MFAIVRKLEVCGWRVFVLALLLPSEIAALSHVSIALAALELGDAFLKGEAVAGPVCGGGVRLPQHLAKCDCTAARSLRVLAFKRVTNSGSESGIGSIHCCRGVSYWRVGKGVLHDSPWRSELAADGFSNAQTSFRSLRANELCGKNS